MRHRVILTIPKIPYFAIIPYFSMANKAELSFRGADLLLSGVALQVVVSAENGNGAVG